MRKIYMVIGDNGEEDFEYHRWWNERAFSSRESAQRFIYAYTEDFEAKVRRYEELEELLSRMDLTEMQWLEHEKLYKELGFDPEFSDRPDFYIEEYELYD